MNKERMECLAQQLEALPVHRFSGWDWGISTTHIDAGQQTMQLDTVDKCGTRACIAGWCCLFAGHKVLNGEVIDSTGRLVGDVSDVAAKELGLDDDEADQLFYPDGELGWSADDPKSAADAVRRFMNE